MQIISCLRKTEIDLKLLQERKIIPNFAAENIIPQHAKFGPLRFLGSRKPIITAVKYMHKSDYNWRLHLENDKHIGTLIVIVFLAVLPSCTAVQEETAFDRVANYYRSNGDTLKIRAAEFLRDYSDYHRGVSRNWVDSIGEMAEKA